MGCLILGLVELQCDGTREHGWNPLLRWHYWKSSFTLSSWSWSDQLKTTSDLIMPVLLLVISKKTILVSCFFRSVFFEHVWDEIDSILRGQPVLLKTKAWTTCQYHEGHSSTFHSVYFLFHEETLSNYHQCLIHYEVGLEEWQLQQ